MSAGRRTEGGRRHHLAGARHGGIGIWEQTCRLPLGRQGAVRLQVEGLGWVPADYFARRWARWTRIENQRGDLEPLIIFIPTGTVATTYCVIAESDVSTKLTGKGSTEKARLGTAEAP